MPKRLVLPELPPINELIVEPKKVALVLGPGGYTGAFQPKAMKVIRDGGIPIEKIFGISVGAVNGANYDDLEKLIAHWNTIKKSSDVFKYQPAFYFIRKLGTPESIFQLKPLLKLVSLIDPVKLIRSEREFIAVATKVPSGRTMAEEKVKDGVVYFSTRDPELVSDPKKLLMTIVASCAFPGGFPAIPIHYRGVWNIYVDGAFDRLLPILKAVDSGCNTIIVIRSHSDRDRRPYPTNHWMKTLAYSMDMKHNREEKDEIRTIRRAGQVNLFVIEPEWLPKTMGTVSFKRGDLQTAMSEGERIAARVVEPLICHFRSLQQPTGGGV